MGKGFDIDAEVDRLRAEYVAATGEEPFEHFFCPILFEDRDVELCAGHVVSQSIANTCRRCVVQRKDVDNFFGSIVEDDFATAIAAQGKSIDDFVNDDALRKKVSLSLSIDGQETPHYEVHKEASSQHPFVHIEKGDGGFLTVALKVSPETLPDQARLQITVDEDYTYQAIGSLLKAAHLTMFAVMGYQYVFSAAGCDIARILREFYLKYRTVTGAARTAAARDYFEPYAGMVMPLGGFANESVRGSVEDSRFLVCAGSSGRFYALGVLIRTNAKMSIVLLAPDYADIIDTYMHFTRDRWKEPFRYHLADFVPAHNDEGAYWKGYKNEFIFDPGEKPNVVASP